MRLDQPTQLGNHFRMGRSHVTFFQRIAPQMKEYGRVMPLQPSLRIPRLRLKMRLPLAPTAGKQLVPTIIEKRPKRQDRPLKPRPKKVTSHWSKAGRMRKKREWTAGSTLMG